MVEDISPLEFARRRDTDARWQLVDVREQWEIDTVSLPQTVSIPMMEIPQRHTELDHSRPLAVLCHSGVRSRRVAEFLIEKGFAEVANIAGGIDAWAQALDKSLRRY